MLLLSDFRPPSPGVWELEATHTVRPFSRAYGAVVPAPSTAGFRESTRRYGLLLDTMEFAAINSYIYVCIRAVGAPQVPKGPPPKTLFTIMTKVHPEIRRRNRTITEVFAHKLWRNDIQRWDREIKPQIAQQNAELQAVDLVSLGDDQLIDHLAACFDAVGRAWFQHHSLNATALLPLGDFLVHVEQWTGRSPGTVMPLFRGASPASNGAATELLAVGAALRDEPTAIALLEGTDSAAILTDLLAQPGQVGDTVRRYLDTTGIRMATGYDFADLTFAEMPDLLVNNIRSTVHPAVVESDDGMTTLEADVREQIPVEHRAEFDNLLTEARVAYRIRDERTYYNDTWSTGIARRAILEAGRRLVTAGRLHAADHAVDLTPDELTAAIRGGGPSAEEVFSRAAFRVGHTTADAPPLIGGTPSPPPPADWLPPDAARAQRAIAMVIGLMFTQQPGSEKSSTVNGFAASPGIVVGNARLVLVPTEMERIRQGDILVTGFTSPAFNGVLPIISAVVTDRGGSLSHAALVAREFGIPAVVGCGNATRLIKDGMLIKVDGVKGTVDILS